LQAARVFGVLVVVATALALVAPAAGYHFSHIYEYYSGTLASGEYRTVTMACSNHVSESRYDWSGPSAYGTAAIIAPSGTWLASDRSSVGYAIANVSPSNPDAYKALCKNSSTGFVWVNAFCHDTVAFSHTICS
jgi:hypothetical protein